jgi:hypothetical protein
LTIREGQDALARIGLGKERVDRAWDIAVTLQEVRLNRPISFGELCLEEWRVRMVKRVKEIREKYAPLGVAMGVPVTMKPHKDFTEPPLALRRAIYHRSRP